MIINLTDMYKNKTLFNVLRSHGDDSAEELRETLLAPAMKKAIENNELLIINMKDVSMTPSYIHESILSLVEIEGFTKQQYNKYLRILK